VELACTVTREVEKRLVVLARPKDIIGVCIDVGYDDISVRVKSA
jgi:hypothetical protein